MISRACAAPSDIDFSSDDSSSSEEDEKVKRKPGDFTGLYLMSKSSRLISDSDSESLSLRMPFATKASCFARFFMRTRS
jgi:hypothetical protein